MAETPEERWARLSRDAERDTNRYLSTLDQRLSSPDLPEWERAALDDIRDRLAAGPMHPDDHLDYERVMGVLSPGSGLPTDRRQMVVDVYLAEIHRRAQQRARGEADPVPVIPPDPAYIRARERLFARSEERIGHKEVDAGEVSSRGPREVTANFEYILTHKVVQDLQATRFHEILYLLGQLDFFRKAGRSYNFVLPHVVKHEEIIAFMTRLADGGSIQTNGFACMLTETVAAYQADPAVNGKLIRDLGLEPRLAPPAVASLAEPGAEPPFPEGLPFRETMEEIRATYAYVRSLDQRLSEVASQIESAGIDMGLFREAWSALVRTCALITEGGRWLTRGDWHAGEDMLHDLRTWLRIRANAVIIQGGSAFATTFGGNRQTMEQMMRQSTAEQVRREIEARFAEMVRDTGKVQKIDSVDDIAAAVEAAQAVDLRWPNYGPPMSYNSAERGMVHDGWPWAGRLGDFYRDSCVPPRQAGDALVQFCTYVILFLQGVASSYNDFLVSVKSFLIQVATTLGWLLAVLGPVVPRLLHALRMGATLARSGVPTAVAFAALDQLVKGVLFGVIGYAFFDRAATVLSNWLLRAKNTLTLDATTTLHLDRVNQTMGGEPAFPGGTWPQPQSMDEFPRVMSNEDQSKWRVRTGPTFPW